jgi:CheY-like chemotaxis protein
MPGTRPGMTMERSEKALNRSNLNDFVQGAAIEKCFDNSRRILFRGEGRRKPREFGAGAMQGNPRIDEDAIRQARVLIVDDEFYMRKVIRTLLLSMGVTNVHDVADGASGLDAILAFEPDVVLLDWEMSGMNGTEFVRRVRSPATFAHPNVPIIMLTGHGQHWRVVQAMRLGVHEFLLKPISAHALHARLASVLLKPRPMVRSGDYYGPERRKIPRADPELESMLRLDAGMPFEPQPQPEVDRARRDVILVD